MRTISNPEKEKCTKILYKQHRVIIPVYIPNSDEEYYSSLFDVFKISIESLFATIDLSTVNITVINNNCKEEVTAYIDSLLDTSKIDKHVKLVANYGKVYTILSEAKASYEDFVTIADADVFYFNNWEYEIFQIFNNFSKAGVVSPVPAPHLSFYCNSSLFFDKYRSIKKGVVIQKESFDLFEQGVGNEVFNSKKQLWRKEQLFLKNKNIKACIGAGHFVATYKQEIFNNIKVKKPTYAFKGGDEEFYLDKPIDKLGYYRLSTINTYAYHLGNTIPKWISNYSFVSKKKKVKLHLKRKRTNNKIPFGIKDIFLKVIKKYNLISIGK